MYNKNNPQEANFSSSTFKILRIKYIKNMKTDDRNSTGTERRPKSPSFFYINTRDMVWVAEL